MDRMRYSDHDLEMQRQQALIEKDIFPVDFRIQRLRNEIRERIHYIRNLKQKGYSTVHAERLLELLCRTLAVDRAYRRAMLKAIQSGGR